MQQCTGTCLGDRLYCGKRANAKFLFHVHIIAYLMNLMLMNLDNESILFIIIFFKIQTVTEQAMGSNSTDGTIIKYKRMTRSRISLRGGGEARGVCGSCLMFTHEIGGESGGARVWPLSAHSCCSDIMRGLTTNGVNTTHTGCMMNNT